MTTVNARTAVLPEETQEHFGKYHSIITLNLIYIIVLCKKRLAQVLLPARNQPIFIHPND